MAERTREKNKQELTLPPLAPETADEGRAPAQGTPETTAETAAGEETTADAGRAGEATEGQQVAAPEGERKETSGGKAAEDKAARARAEKAAEADMASEARVQAGEEEEKALPVPKSVSQTLPMPTEEGGLAAYLQKIRQFPILSAEEEYMLAKRWREHADTEAAHKLVTSHLRLVAKIAMGYRGYGLPISEIISEGNVGLMQAVKRFEPDKGFRLATYAMWWIKAAIQEYILRSWSLVKMGTTASQKKLFFNLRKLKGQIKALEEGDMRPEQVKEIAERLGVSEEDVISMNRRLAGDASLNAPLRNDGDSSGEWQDWLVDESENQEEQLAEREEHELRMKMLKEAMEQLNERERRIFEARRLREPPLTLEELSKEFGVSRERIRQIEVRAFEKVQKAMREMAAKAGAD